MCICLMDLSGCFCEVVLCWLFWCVVCVDVCGKFGYLLIVEGIVEVWYVVELVGGWLVDFVV